MDTFEKAVLDSTSNTTGLNLLRAKYDPRIFALATVKSPLRQRINRVKWNNTTYDVASVSGIPAGNTYAENQQWITTHSQYGTPVSRKMKTVGNLGGVSNYFQEGTQEYLNALDTEIDNVTTGVVQTEEWLLLHGNSGVDATQFDGVAAQLVSNVGYSTPSNPQALSADILDAMDDDVTNRNADPASLVWVMPPSMATNVARLNTLSFRQEGNGLNVIGGFNTNQYRGHEIIKTSAAETYVGRTLASVPASGGSTTVFAFGDKFVQAKGINDFRGNYFNSGVPGAAPLVYVGGSLANANTYTINVNHFTGASTIVFNSAPGGAVTATYFFKQSNIFLLDTSVMDVRVMHEIGLDRVFYVPDYDNVQFRIKAYELLAVQIEARSAAAFAVNS